MRRKARVVVAMSGGVDSALTAALLVEGGYDVVGLSMRLWEAGDGPSPGGCCSLDDFLDARRVAEQLGIPFYVMDFREEFRRSVVDEFVAEYRAGRTPNPCARCNQFVKFAALWERAQELGAERIATGHYARSRVAENRVELLRGVDRDKDQSYFLFPIDPEVLRRTLFPVGELTKADVRREARRRRLAVAEKPDSQEVCFAPRGDYAAFVEAQVSAQPIRDGLIVDAAGEVVGRHSGVHRFTIGQRRGLGLRQGGGPRYVTAIDAASGTVHIGSADEAVRTGLVATQANWLGPLPTAGARVSIKIRSRFSPRPVVVMRAEAAGFEVLAPGGLRAVTPGQAAVLYDGERVVGGGWISRALSDVPHLDLPPQGTVDQSATNPSTGLARDRTRNPTKKTHDHGLQ